MPARRLYADRGRLPSLLTAGCVSARHSSSSTICSGFTPSWGQIRESRTGLCRSAWEESTAAGRAGSGWQEKLLVSPCKAVPAYVGRVLSPTNMSHVQAPSSPRTALCPCASPLPALPPQGHAPLLHWLQTRVRRKRWLSRSRCAMHTAVRQSGRLPAVHRRKGNLVAGP